MYSNAVFAARLPMIALYHFASIAIERYLINYNISIIIILLLVQSLLQYI